ncbi:hypothetical protein [Candidatus Phytoplasma pyri]|uniref:hypothetical protein n=1 Tax=Candidatus Phytoplasma pyri TaxID=47566 RepID=UPI0039834AFF
MIYQKSNQKNKKSLFTLGRTQIIILCILTIIYIISIANTFLNLHQDNENFTAIVYKLMDRFLFNFLFSLLYIYFWEVVYNGSIIFKKNQYSIMQLENEKQKLYENIKNLEQKEILLSLKQNKK